MRTQNVSKAEAAQHDLKDGALTLGPVGDEWSWYSYESHTCEYGCPDDCDVVGTITKDTYTTMGGSGLWREVPAGEREVEPGRYEVAYYEWKQVLGTSQYARKNRAQLIREHDLDQGEYGTTYRNTPRIPKQLLF